VKETGDLPNLAGVRVFAVDDHPDTIEGVRAFLELAGAQVECAYSAIDALASPGLAKCDVVISDLSMPRMTGYEFIAAIRQRPSSEGGTVPAIAVSAYEDALNKATTAGFTLIMRKPVDPFALMRNVALLVATNDQRPTLPSDVRPSDGIRRRRED
jgi:CheY-like chemotaxis protein